METNDLPITVTENENGTFTLEWDDNHPAAAVINNWTTDHLQKVIRIGLQEIQLEKADRDARTEFSSEEFEKNFDELFDRVENGETLTIVDEFGHRVFMLPYTEYKECLTGSTQKNDSNSEQTA